MFATLSFSAACLKINNVHKKIVAKSASLGIPKLIFNWTTWFFSFCIYIDNFFFLHHVGRLWLVQNGTSCAVTQVP